MSGQKQEEEYEMPTWIMFTLLILVIGGTMWFGLSQETKVFHTGITAIDSTEYQIGFRTDQDVSMCTQLFNDVDNQMYCLGFKRIK